VALKHRDVTALTAVPAPVSAASASAASFAAGDGGGGEGGGEGGGGDGGGGDGGGGEGGGGEGATITATTVASTTFAAAAASGSTTSFAAARRAHRAADRDALRGVRRGRGRRERRRSKDPPRTKLEQLRLYPRRSCPATGRVAAARTATTRATTTRAAAARAAAALGPAESAFALTSAFSAACGTRPQPQPAARSPGTVSAGRVAAKRGSRCRWLSDAERRRVGGEVACVEDVLVPPRAAAQVNVVELVRVRGRGVGGGVLVSQKGGLPTRPPSTLIVV